MNRLILGAIALGAGAVIANAPASAEAVCPIGAPCTSVGGAGPIFGHNPRPIAPGPVVGVQPQIQGYRFGHGDGGGGDRWRFHRERRHNFAWGDAGAALAAGALFGGLAASQDQYYYGDNYAPVYAGDDGEAYCIRRYRSYDPYSRTYLGYDGVRHPCP